MLNGMEGEFRQFIFYCKKSFRREYEGKESKEYFIKLNKNLSFQIVMIY